MKRREFCSALGLATVASLTNAKVPRIRGAEADATAGRQPVNHSPVTVPPSKKLLFFDLWKLDYWDNAELVQGTPEFVPEATYVDDTIPGKGAGKPNVYFDKGAGIWRMLYNIAWSPVRLMTAISDDGIHWKPDPHSSDCTYTITGGLPCPSWRRPVSSRRTCTVHVIRRLRICGA